MAVAHVLHLVAPDGVCLPARRHIVEHVAVRARHNSGVVGGLCAAFDLDAVDARVHDVVQMVDHAHIARVHDVSALLVLKDREIFSGTLFLHQRVLIAAGLGAGAAV